MTESNLNTIAALPPQMQEHALVPWATVAAMMGAKDVQYARETLKAAGLPLVRVSSRRELPRWGALRDFLKSREA